MICRDVNNKVISLPVSGEVFSRVINDVVCADSARHVQIPRAAHAGHFSAERFGKLHRKRTHTTRCAVNQDLLPGPNLPFVAKSLQSGHRRYRDGCCRLKRDIGRFQQQRPFSNRCILGETALACGPEYLITWLELRCVFANHFNPPRNVRAEYRVFWFPKPSDQKACYERFTSHEMPVSRIYGYRMNFYQDFVIPGSRFFHLLELKNVR